MISLVFNLIKYSNIQIFKYSNIQIINPWIQDNNQSYKTFIKHFTKIITLKLR